MEKKTIGSFLAALRKANGMTQQEVADKLNVSNKTVSKWERDEGCPEIMMLPAIAELYSVTVDEILRGERIAKTESEEIKDTKSEKQIKYLVERATTRFKNLSIISVVLGVASMLLAYTIGDMLYDYNFLWVGLLITLLLASASVIVIAIAVNNLLSGFSNEEIINNDTLQATKKTCIKYISTITFLSILILCGIILNIVFSGVSFAFSALPAFCVIAGIPTYFVRSKLNKKWGIEEPELSPKFKKYRKKHIKITSIIIAISVVLSFVLPFVFVIVENILPNRTFFYFPDGVGYQYATVEEAQNEYLKLKGYIVEDKKLYSVMSKDYENHILVVEEILYDFQETEKGYEAVSYYAQTNEYETMYFDSEEEMDKFEYENCWSNSESIHLSSLQEKITFDDETYTVYYAFDSKNNLSQAFDILPVFLIGGSCVCIVIFGISVGIYFKNKKKIQ